MAAGGKQQPPHFCPRMDVKKGDKVLQDNAKQPPLSGGAIWIGRGDLRARILFTGASLQDLRLAPFANPLVLSLPDAAYCGAQRSFYAGAVVGRVAGRIGQACAPFGAGQLALDTNEGAHHLHGGAHGFAHRDWHVSAHSAHSVTLTLRSPAGEGGYPGTMDVTAIYTVLPDAVLSLRLVARSDADTVLNLCHHPYFNLNGAPQIDGHTLECPAQTYLPADAAALPTGEVAAVAGTEFDFRTQRAIGSSAFDNSLCLHTAPCGPLAFAARLGAGPDAPVMEIWTTQPALHIYDGAGIGHAPRAALALEAQGWPDAPNNPHFPSITLTSGAVYDQTTEYRFFV